MFRRFKRVGGAAFAVLFFPVIISAVSCSDMYSEMLDNMPGNYRLGIFVTTMTMVNYLIISDSDVNLSQKSVFAGYSTGYDGTVADFNRDGNLDMLTVAPDEKPMIAFTDGKGKITHYSDFYFLHQTITLQKL